MHSDHITFSCIWITYIEILNDILNIIITCIKNEVGDVISIFSKTNKQHSFTMIIYS